MSPSTRDSTLDRLLTPREREILYLLSAGHTDREIGELLYVSRRTVNTHVAHLLDKLDVTSRRDAVTVAKSHGLLASG